GTCAPHCTASRSRRNGQSSRRPARGARTPHRTGTARPTQSGNGHLRRRCLVAVCSPSRPLPDQGQQRPLAVYPHHHAPPCCALTALSGTGASACSAASAVSCMPKIAARPVTAKIFAILGGAAATAITCPCFPAAFRAPTSTPSPVESIHVHPARS